MKHSAGPPPPGRRRPSGWRRLKPRSSQAFVLGVCMAVGGLAGGVRAAVDGEGVWKALGIFGVGVLGVVLAVSWIVTYARER
ncbi:hypothetical protein AMK26_27940 [Streptomyces sp. CB03234]|uniref:hypothetical protein n=1 Tax=Streptomyces sp. (strain CB03234) TaxID=1703937 RepID=UPI000939E51F|nr:hypothetical protein [Streptomyces sp. CB03234]OKJ99814.1 hypothetical protein AMK26_27940 [Streptomyces sp. CB03234]